MSNNEVIIIIYLLTIIIGAFILFLLTWLFCDLCYYLCKKEPIIINFFDFNNEIEI